MKYLYSILLIGLFYLLSSQVNNRSSVWLPYKKSPINVQIWDTNGVEISYIFYDPISKRTVVRGSLQEGLQRLNDVYDQTLVPAQELNYAASRVRLYLNTNGTVRRRDSLTVAIRYYDSIKVRWGLLE